MTAVRKCHCLFMCVIGMSLLGCIHKQHATATEKTVEGTPAVPRITIIDNVNLISMIDDTINEKYTVLVTNGIISAVGPADSIIKPLGAQLIDGTGQYLIPGLVDMHVHYWFSHLEDPLYLANGVTAIQNMWGSQDILRIRLFNNNRATGLRIFTAGPIMDGPNPIHRHSLVVNNAEEAKLAVLDQQSQGYDAIKVYELLSPETYQAITETAKAMGLRVLGHVPRQLGLSLALSSGQHSIEHLSGYSLANIDIEARMTKDHNVWNTPTLAISHIVRDESTIEGLEYVSPNTIKTWREYKAAMPVEQIVPKLEHQQELVRVLHRQKARLLAGTDANNPFVVPGFSLHSELEYLAGAGLSPYEALKTATFNPAVALGQIDTMGTIEPGKWADMVLLSKNPFEDIRNTRTITGTMLRGIWYGSQALQEQLNRLKAGH